MSSAPRLFPSSLNWTPTTPTLSEALADTVTPPETVAPAAGALMETVGGVVSEEPDWGTSARNRSLRPEPFMSEVNRTYSPSDENLANVK